MSTFAVKRGDIELPYSESPASRNLIAASKTQHNRNHKNSSMSMERRNKSFQLNFVPTNPEAVKALIKDALRKLEIELDLHSPDKVDVDEIAKLVGVFLSPY